MKRVIPTLALACLIAAPRALHAQAGDRALDIGPNRTGLSIGDSREWTGVRLNYRDSRLRRVRGVNATIWRPYDGGHGDVMGLALGVPLTGGRNVQGIQVAAGIEATDELGGVGISLLGMGAGERVWGIMLAGLGVGSGGDLRGIVAAGIGAGAGGDARGGVLGGVGAWRGG